MVVTAIIAAGVAAAGTAAAAFIAGTTLTWAAVAVAAAGAFISTGIGYLLAEKPKTPVGSANRTARATLRQATVPARYVLGEARVGGWLFYAGVHDQEGRRLELGIGISEGDIEDITAFYADGERIPVNTPNRTMTSAGGRILTYLGTMGEESSPGADDAVDYTGRFAAVCYLDSSTPELAAANGANLRRTTAGAWKETDVVPIAWVHLRLTQGPGPGGIAGPWRTAHINWEFQVKGMRITWPGQTTPEWTDDAAAIRYWYDTVIRGRTVDETSFAAARAICMGVPPDSFPTIQLSTNRLALTVGQTRAVTASLSGTSDDPVTVSIGGAPDDGLSVSPATVLLPGNFTVSADRVGVWRLTVSSPIANPATLLVEVTE